MGLHNPTPLFQRVNTIFKLISVPPPFKKLRYTPGNIIEQDKDDKACEFYDVFIVHDPYFIVG